MLGGEFAATYLRRVLDSLTHIVLGACIGEAIAGKKLGKKAMLIGAIANSLPDVDVAASLWLDNASNLLAHRGITHSFLFLALVSPVVAWLSMVMTRRRNSSFGHWWALWGINMLFHLLIDSFTAYGTGLFEPFNHSRISFNSVFVLDPIYTIFSLVAAIALLALKTDNRHRARVANIAIVLTALYIVHCFNNKVIVDKVVKQSFRKWEINPTRYMTTPTPANSLLWYIVADVDTGFYIGYRSVMDKTNTIVYDYVPKNDELLFYAPDKNALRKLKQFSQGYYCAALHHDSLFFSDMRFGETGTWLTGTPDFVFSYCLQYPGANDNVLQRRRMALADRKALSVFWKRIWGE